MNEPKDLDGERLDAAIARAFGPGALEEALDDATAIREGESAGISIYDAVAAVESLEVLRPMALRAYKAIETLAGRVAVLQATITERDARDAAAREARAQGAEVYDLVEALERNDRPVKIPEELGTVVGTLDGVLVIVLPDDVPDDMGERIAEALHETSGTHSYSHILFFPRAVRALRIARRP